MRNRFDTQLEQLQESMTQMGDKCLSSITDTIDALNTGNEKLATAVISRTRTIRRDEREMMLRLILPKSSQLNMYLQL